MRVLSSGALAALDSGRFAVRCLLKVEHDDGPLCIWDDVGSIDYGGDTYVGAAGRFTVAPVPSSLDGGARPVDVTLSGFDIEVANVIDGAGWHQRPISIVRAILAVDTPQVIHTMPVFAGYLDQMLRSERAGSSSTMVFRCEAASRELGRRGARTRSDPDQRQRDPVDGFFKHTVNSVQQQFEWGRVVQQPAKSKKLFGIF